MKLNHVFVFDVESYGLHGQEFSVAGGVYTPTNIEWEFCYACRRIDGAVNVDEDMNWVNENVPVVPFTHVSDREMRNAFWRVWMMAKSFYEGIIMAADCPWPVEARFLANCIEDDIAVRRWEGPYPLIDIASVQIAKGIDPMGEFERLQCEMPKHHPLMDARQSARLLFEALEFNPYDSLKYNTNEAHQRSE